MQGGGGDGHGIALCACDERGTGLGILREGNINEIVGGKIEAVLVDVADDADDLGPSFAVVEGDAAADGILVVPVTLRDGLRDDGDLGAFGASAAGEKAAA